MHESLGYTWFTWTPFLTAHAHDTHEVENDLSAANTRAYSMHVAEWRVWKLWSLAVWQNKLDFYPLSSIYWYPVLSFAFVFDSAYLSFVAIVITKKITLVRKVSMKNIMRVWKMLIIPRAPQEWNLVFMISIGFLQDSALGSFYSVALCRLYFVFI